MAQRSTMEEPFTDEQWATLDDLILSRQIIRTLKQMRDWRGMSLREALDLHAERYRLLRATRPDDFCCSHEEYWDEVYS